LGVRLTQVTSEYDVAGQSIPELTLSIRTRALLQPDHTTYGGYTTWSLAWAYSGTRIVPGGCSTTGVTVNLDLKVRYPAWKDTAAAPSLREEWNRYVTALKAHEGQHAAIAIRGANLLASKLRDIVAPFCASVQGDAARIANETRQWIRDESNRYDETTRHGATEGANLRRPGQPPPQERPQTL
jgi:predicted secreted Zn-dependent protease